MDTDRNHFRAVIEAAHRRRVTRYEHVGKKIVKVVYMLVHSTNEKELMKAHARRQELQQRVRDRKAGKTMLKIAKHTD